VAVRFLLVKNAAGWLQHHLNATLEDYHELSAKRSPNYLDTWAVSNDLKLYVDVWVVFGDYKAA